MQICDGVPQFFSFNSEPSNNPSTVVEGATMTSPPENIRVKCPKWGKVYKDWYRESINLILDDFDDDYLDEYSSVYVPIADIKLRLTHACRRKTAFVQSIKEIKPMNAIKQSLIDVHLLLKKEVAC
jgi:hypothetical protein